MVPGTTAAPARTPSASRIATALEGQIASVKQHRSGHYPPPQPIHRPTEFRLAVQSRTLPRPLHGPNHRLLTITEPRSRCCRAPDQHRNRWQLFRGTDPLRRDAGHRCRRWRQQCCQPHAAERSDWRRLLGGEHRRSGTGWVTAAGTKQGYFCLLRQLDTVFSSHICMRLALAAQQAADWYSQHSRCLRLCVLLTRSLLW